MNDVSRIKQRRRCQRTSVLLSKIIMCLFLVVSCAMSPDVEDELGVLNSAETWVISIMKLDEGYENSTQLFRRIWARIEKDAGHHLITEQTIEAEEIADALDKNFQQKGVDASDVPTAMKSTGSLRWAVIDLNNDSHQDLFTYSVGGSLSCADYNLYLNVDDKLIPAKTYHPTLFQYLARFTDEGKFCVEKRLVPFAVDGRVYLLLMSNERSDNGNDIVAIDIFYLDGTNRSYSSRLTIPYETRRDLDASAPNLCVGSACEWAIAHANELSLSYVESAWNERETEPRFQDNPITGDRAQEAGNLDRWTRAFETEEKINPVGWKKELATRIDWSPVWQKVELGDYSATYYPLRFSGDLFLLRVSVRGMSVRDRCCVLAVLKPLADGLDAVVIAATRNSLVWGDIDVTRRAFASN